MMIQELAIALRFLVVHAPGGQEIDINVEEVASLREPRDSDASLVHEGANCMIFMSSGKFIAVIEGCREIRKALEQNQ